MECNKKSAVGGGASGPVGSAAIGDLPEKLGWHLGVGISDVRGVRSDCPAWLAELISKLAAKETADRPADGAAALKMFQERRAQGAQTQAPAPATTARPAASSTVALDKNAVAEAVRQVRGEI
jgi:hypothetical protein